MTSIHVACAADAGYLHHSAAMLHSLVEHAGADTTIHYLHGPGLTQAQAEQLARMCETPASRIEFHPIEQDAIRGLPVENRFGPAMWYRILLPELLPSVPKLLYLDIDTIVMDAITPLWDLDLGSNLLGAVRNVFMEFHQHRPGQVGVEAAEYFNSGVLMLNLDLMRSERFSEQVIELVSSEDRELEWPDQDALNLVARRRWLALHPRWNAMNTLFSRPALAGQAFGSEVVAEAVRTPAIRHFEGPGFNKPWHRLHDRGGQRLYRRHRRATPWPRYRLEGGGPEVWLRRLLADAHVINRLPGRPR